MWAWELGRERERERERWKANHRAEEYRHSTAGTKQLLSSAQRNRELMQAWMLLTTNQLQSMTTHNKQINPSPLHNFFIFKNLFNKLLQNQKDFIILLVF